MTLEKRLRMVMFTLHKYLSLIAGVFILILAITGTIMVFEWDLEDLWNRRFLVIEPQNRPMLSAGEMAAAAARAFPGQRTDSVALPRSPSRAAVILMSGGRIFLNPYTGEVTGRRNELNPILGWIIGFHIRLNAGFVGARIVDSATVVVLFLSVSGVYLWWPLKRATVRLAGNRWRINFDLHNALGIYSCMFILVLGLTGLGFPYGDKVFEPLQKRAGVAAAELIVQKSAVQQGVPPISADRAIEVARRQFSSGTVRRVALPHRPRDAYFVSLHVPGEPDSPRDADHSWVFVDQYTGKLLSVFNSRTSPVAAQLDNVNRQIHVGHIYGWPSKILAALSGLILATQMLTGLYMWWKRPRPKPGMEPRTGVAL